MLTHPIDRNCLRSAGNCIVMLEETRGAEHAADVSESRTQESVSTPSGSAADSKNTSVVHEYPRGDIADDPVDTGGQTRAGESRARLDAPMPLGRGESVQSELLADFLRGECAVDVLLVGKHEQRGAGEALLLQQLLQLSLAVAQPRAVGRVDHPDETCARLRIDRLSMLSQNMQRWNA